MNIRIMWKVLQELNILRAHDGWTRQELESYQIKSLHALRNHAYSHSLFYRRFHRGLFDRPLQELPILTKATMMENFDDFVTDTTIRLKDVRAYTEQKEGALFLDRYWVTATSGSSGHPGFFLFNEREWLTIMASFARGQEWSGKRPSLSRRRKMATVASVSHWHMSSQVARTAKSWWVPSLRLASSDPLESIVQRLNNWQPDVLVSYASMARILAEEQINGRLQIYPEVIFTSSEVLTEETRRRVKSAWGNEPFNQYGATETADIAAECKEGRRMHVFEDLLILEVVDNDYQPVPHGIPGTKLLVTTLFSRTQPLIRYELNDRILLSGDACTCGTPDECACSLCTCIKLEMCPCGRPFATLESIQGREEDTLLLPALAGDKVFIRPLVFNRVMDVLPISGWQVAQEQDEGLTVLLSGARIVVRDDSLVEQINKSLVDNGAYVPYVNIQHVNVIPKSASGKMPLIKAFKNN